MKFERKGNVKESLSIGEYSTMENRVKMIFTEALSKYGLTVERSEGSEYLPDSKNLAKAFDGGYMDFKFYRKESRWARKRRKLKYVTGVGLIPITNRYREIDDLIRETLQPKILKLLQDKFGIQSVVVSSDPKGLMEETGEEVITATVMYV